MRVRFEAYRETFDGALNESPLAKAIAQALPISSTVQRWGDEIYFAELLRTVEAGTAIRVEPCA